MGMFNYEIERLLRDFALRTDNNFLKTNQKIDNYYLKLNSKLDTILNSPDHKLDEILLKLNKVLEDIKALKFTLAYKPGSLTLIQTGETMDIISFKVVLPTVVDADVESRELSVKIGDADAVVTAVAKDAVEVNGLSGPQDAAIELSLVDIDDAGNKSQASVLNTVLTDVFPPATPGELSIQQTGETTVE
jgi:hypothetical protein